MFGAAKRNALPDSAKNTDKCKRLILKRQKRAFDAVTADIAKNQETIIMTIIDMMTDITNQEAMTSDEAETQAGKMARADFLTNILTKNNLTFAMPK